MSKIFVIKIGGQIIDDEKKLAAFLSSFAAIEEKKILVHGGGKLATRYAEQLNIPQQVVEGRRITDAETLKIVTMVYAGYVNKQIIAGLQANSCNAIGLTGADGDAILAHKRIHPVLDYGYVGDVDMVNAGLISGLLSLNTTPVFAPITHDQRGQLLNTNADTIAQEIATSLSESFKVTLVYTFEKAGVLTNINDEHSVIPVLNKDSYRDLKTSNTIYAGMIPKLDNAFAALKKGVEKVIIGKAENLLSLLSGSSGTTIIND
jgi:acetylglutamate kinase